MSGRLSPLLDYWPGGKLDPGTQAPMTASSAQPQRKPEVNVYTTREITPCHVIVETETGNTEVCAQLIIGALNDTGQRCYIAG